MGTSWKERYQQFNWHKMAIGIGMAGLIGGAFLFGRAVSPPAATAQDSQVAIDRKSEPPLPPPNASKGDSDYSKRAVAFIYDNEVITREELGEYLIARFGAERLDMLINKRVIDRASQEKGFDVTPAEIEAALEDDVKSLNVSKTDFVNKVLKRYNKSLYEWREDVIRPKLLMEKMVRDRVTVRPEDLAKCFDAHYGERVKCQMIMFGKDEPEKKAAQKAWEAIRKNPEEFDRFARQQSSIQLARTGGMLDPVARHTTGREGLEQVLFSLDKGEISPVVETPEGIVIVKSHGKIPANKEVKLENERAALEKEIIEKKMQLEMPKFFEELRKKANVKVYLTKPQTDNDVINEVEKEIRQTKGDKK